MLSDDIDNLLEELARLKKENAELREEISGLYAELDFITSRSWEGRP